MVGVLLGRVQCGVGLLAEGLELRQMRDVGVFSGHFSWNGVEVNVLGDGGTWGVDMRHYFVLLLLRSSQCL